MNNSFTYKNDRPWPNRRLKKAAIVGHTTENGSRLWFRTGEPGNFTLLYFPVSKGDENTWFEEIKHNESVDLGSKPDNVLVEKFLTKWDTDTTHVVELKGLSSGAKYQYALLSDKDERIILGHDKQYCFSTLNADGKPFRFGLFSCHMPFVESDISDKTVEIANMDMWTSMQSAFKKKPPAFLIAGGDQCYADGIPSLNIWKYLNKVMKQNKGKKGTLPTEEDMLSWYRDIYRGYWGFDSVRSVFSSIPTYMIWDDHEMGDGWGSFYLNASSGRDPEWDEIFPGFESHGYKIEDLKELLSRMEKAGKQAYQEYEHSHNPLTPEGQYDYDFSHENCAFYVLDGRGHRDINRDKNRILGDAQLQRFQQYVDGIDNNKTDFLFVVSAVPMLHLCSGIANMENWITDKANLDDDLRDSWEHELHDEERGELMKILFSAAARGIRVCILSGDVHISAVFRISDGKNPDIYQLTSSAITYNVGTMLGRALGWGVADEGQTAEGHDYERLALYTEPSYSIIRVNPKTKEVYFQIYGRQKIQPTKRNTRMQKNRPPSLSREEEMEIGRINQEKPIFNSIAKIKLW